MKKNVKFAGALTITSLLTILALYFHVHPMAVLTFSMCLTMLISFIVMMSSYHYNGYDFNDGQFWFVYSALGGVIIIALLYTNGVHIINPHLAESAILGLAPTTIPVIGLFIGDCGRVLIKNEPSVI